MELNFKLKIKDQEIELTYEEGRKLFDILKRVYGEQHPVWQPTQLSTFGDTFNPAPPFIPTCTSVWSVNDTI